MKGYIDEDGYIRVKVGKHYRRKHCIYDGKRCCNNACIGFGEPKEILGSKFRLPSGEKVETIPHISLKVCNLYLDFEEFEDRSEKDLTDKDSIDYSDHAGHMYRAFSKLLRSTKS